MPEGCWIGRGPRATTVPEVGACRAALTVPAGSASICPFNTRSPTATMGRAGAPRCMFSGSTSCAGFGPGAIGVRLDTVLCSAGCTPPGKS